MRYAIPTVAKAAGSLSTLLRKKFPEEDFEAHFDAWEHEIAKYERDTRSIVSDDVKIGVIMGGTSGPLNEHLTLHSSTFTNFGALRNVCMNYHKNGAAFRAAAAGAALDGAAINFMKGKGKGRVKGKGKGNSHSKGYGGKRTRQR